MNQNYTEMLTVPGMDNQTAVAVQSLIESQTITDITPGVDEDDIFQCGKCKKQFCSLSAFLNHKQARCAAPRSLLNPVSRSSAPETIASNRVVHSSQESSIISRTPHIPVVQTTMPTYSTVAPSSVITQNMVLTDDLLSFNPGVDQSITPQTLQLPNGAVQSNGSFLPQVASYPSGSNNNVTILSPVNSSTSLPTSGTMTANHIQIQPALTPQQTALTSIAEKVIKPSPTKAGRKSAQANLVTLVTGNDPNAVVKMRRGKNGALVMEEKKKLHCQYCNKAFSKNFDLQQHIRAHTGEKPFQCIVCGRAFAQKSNVKKHMNTHKVWPSGTGNMLPEQPPLQVEEVITSQPPVSEESPQPVIQEIVLNEKEVMTIKSNEGTPVTVTEHKDSKTRVLIDNSYICQYCPCKFKSYFHLKSHMVQHKNQQVFKCSMKSCSQVFKELDTFLEHIKEHENDMTYRCHICHKNFESLYELGLHQYTHCLYPNQGPKSGLRQFQCTKCMNKYATPEALEHHMNTSSHDHPCPHCNKSFKCERYLRRHLPSHGSEGQFECPTCKKKFKAEHYLKMHNLIHTGENPFLCEICSAAFNRKDKLRRHMLIHETTKRYKCPFRSVTGCTKEFNRTDKLKSHIISHSGMRPYRCQECGRCFSRRPHLIEHERGHRADYKFKCEICHKGFFRPKLFKEHRCVPSKAGETRVRVYRPKSKRKVGRPRKRMITVEPRNTSETVKKSDIVVQNVMVVDKDEERGDLSKDEESELPIEEEANDDLGNSMDKKESKSDGVQKSGKPAFCVKVPPPAPIPRYVTVNLPPHVHGQSGILAPGIQTHFIQSPSSASNYQNIVTSHPSYQPITIIETQPVMPIHVTPIDNVSLSDQMSIQMTALPGITVGDSNNVSVIENVPMQLVMPNDDQEGMVTAHVVVSSSGPDPAYSTAQLDDYNGSEGDPVLQGTENLLKAHAEILQSAQ